MRILNVDTKELPKETGSRLVRIVVAIGLLALLVVIGQNLFENLDSHDIMVIQSPGGGLTVHTEPGIKWQGFGKVTVYPRRSILPFKQPIRFNDNGHGTAIGSVQVEMPLDTNHVLMIHKQYGSAEALKTQLVETVVSKCIYLTGPLMSSKESASEKRNELLQFIEDQIKNGVYRTQQKDIQIPDPLNDKQTKTVTVVEIVKDGAGLARVEQGSLTEYGIKTFNFAIKDLPYDDAVENQIKEQQKLTMQVQTSIAMAKQAEQKALTTAKEGEAEAAKAKWDQEVVKAKFVTEAEQKRDVAALEMKAAEYTKQRLILEGEGEAQRRAKIMAADGALDKKLEAWVKVNGMYASAIEKSQNPLTPGVVMGGGAGAGGNVGLSLADMLMVKTAKELGLQVNPSGK